MYQQDGVVDHQPGQRDKADHGQQIHRLERDQIGDAQRDHAADDRQRQRDDHHQTVAERAEQRAHQQIQDGDGQGQALSHIADRGVLVVSRALVGDVPVLGQLFADDRIDLLLNDDRWRRPEAYRSVASRSA